ncbi:MAG: integrin alpha [Patescibacteria group bacterium]|jgi:hypothetical protein
MKKKIVYLFFLIFFIVPCVGKSAETIDLGDTAKYIGENDGDNAGYVTASAGDVNGDGFDDILIGGYNNDVGGDNAGAAYLIYGQASQITGSTDLSLASAKFIGEEADDNAGAFIGSAGDINNDGYDDFLIGAPSSDSNGNASGAVYLFYGQTELYSADVDLSTADAKFIGKAANDYAAVLGIPGDFNNDNYSDFMIGAYGNDDGGLSAGAVFLFFGQAEVFSGNINLSTADVEFIGEEAGDLAGYSLSAAGDINGDSNEDIIIGAMGDIAYTGSIFLIYNTSSNFAGDYDLSMADARFTGEVGGDLVGYNLTRIGDMNADGYDDMVITAYQNDNNGAAAGTAYLIYGQATDFSGSISLSLSDAIFLGTDISDMLGSSIAGNADINHDGFSDVLIGAYGDDDGANSAGVTFAIYGQSAQYSGNLSMTTAAIYFLGEDVSDFSGNAVAFSDLNNDAFPEVIIGAYTNAEGGASAGAVYLGYVYIDNDGDGLAGTDGLLVGTDTNDNDHDNDGSETGTDCNDDDATISANQTITAGDNGDITITYINNDTSVIDVFSYTGTDVMTLKQYQDNYYLVLHPKAKKLALIDINALTVLSRKTLSKKSFPTNSLKTYTLRNKPWAVITAKNKNNKVKLSLVKIVITQEKLGKKVAVSLVNKKIAPAKTKRNKNTILLRSKNNKIITKFLLTKKFTLKEI